LARSQAVPVLTIPVLAILTISALSARAQAPAQPGKAPAPTPPSTPIADVQHGYAGLKTNILKAADKMPPENYAYRPTPDVRTFARVVNHVTEAQARSCGALNATPEASRIKVPAETADKATIVAALQASFAECDKAFAALSEANMLEMVTAGPATRARISFAWGTISHDNEQYATLALYMRLKGLVPPSSEK
jgi:hypothetical protein